MTDPAPDPVAELARHFARALEHLRTSHDLQYVGTRPLPEPAPLATQAAEDAAHDDEAAITRAAPTSPRSAARAEDAAHDDEAGITQAAPASSRSAARAEDAATTRAAPTSSRSAARAEEAATSRAAPASSRSAARAEDAAHDDEAATTRAAPASSRSAARAEDAAHLSRADADARASDPARPLAPRASGSSPRSDAAPSIASPSTAPSAERDPSAPTPAEPAPRVDAPPGPADRRSSLRVQAQQWTPAQKLEYLRTHNVGDCQRCPLARTRTRIVFGVGNPQADVMFVGEAPGADEDRQGEPFVGRAGQLLNQWLAELGLRREDVYIANVLKCRPPGNRDPRPEEVERCSPFLQAQIRAIEPKVIVALGRHAGMLLSRREELTLRAMRQGRLHYDAGAAKGDASKGDVGRVLIPLVVTYHPAYVLRQEGDARSPATPGRASATEMVMTDLRRALSIARGGA